MTSTTAQPATPAHQQSRGLILLGAIGLAAVATGSAYIAMVGFGRDVVGMSAGVAYTTAGFLEGCLVVVALMAREAAQQERPNGLLLGLTWAFSAASAVFAAWHEIELGHSPAAAVFRFLVPFVAALMWHLVLVGDRHLATGRSWSQLRASGRMHAALEAVEDYHDAWKLHNDPEHGGTAATRKQLVKARDEMKRAGRIARRTVDPEQMGDELAKFVDAFQEFAGGVETAWSLQASTRNIETGAPGPVRAEQLAPMPDVDQVAADLQTAVRGPVELPARVSPAEEPQALTEAVTEPSEPIQPPARPHLVTVPNQPAEETGQTAPEPAAPSTSSSTDTSSTDTTKIQAIALRKEGKKVKEISQRLGVPERTVYRWTNPKKQAS